MPDTQIRTLFSLCSCNFIVEDQACDTFRVIRDRIGTFDNRIVFDEEIVKKDEFEPFTK